MKRSQLQIQTHRRRGSRFFFELLLGAFLFFSSREASAFCLERTCEDSFCAGDSSECVDRLCERGPDGCIIEGYALKHPGPCLSFAVETGAGVHLDLSDAELESTIAQAFERWRFVDCGGNTRPSFVIQRAGLVPSTQKYFCSSRPTENMSVWRSAPSCAGGLSVESGCWGYTDDSLGYASSSFAPETGAIADTDVEFNVAEIANLGFALEDTKEVVLAIATHEAGHFLGIAHSDNPDAIMAATYSSASLASRSFHQDDIDAICTAFPPKEGTLSCPSPVVYFSALNESDCRAPQSDDHESEGGCAIGIARVPSPPSPLAALLIVLSLSMLRRGEQVRQAPCCPLMIRE